MAKEPIKGEGWAVASIDDLGDGPGFRKVCQALDVTEFGVNGVVLPPGYTSRRHYHDRQQELYMVLRGEIEFDHQMPVALPGPRVPGKAHIHSVVRTPNGNDYGKDLLRQHYQRHAGDPMHGHGQPAGDRRR